MSKKIFILFFLAYICIAHYNELLAENFTVSEIHGNIKISFDPSELINLHIEGKINPRVLMAFGKLPDKFVSLATQLHSYDIDLLRADINQIEQYIDEARSGIIDTDPDLLMELKLYIVEMDYISWSELKKGDMISGNELLWFDEKTWMMFQNPDGGESRISSSGIFKLETDNLAFAMPAEDEAVTDDAKDVDTALKLPEAAVEDLSPRAASVYEYWVDIFETKGFPLEIVDGFLVEETSEKIELKALLADYTIDSKSEVNNVLKLHYKPINDELMDFKVQLPERIWLHDEQEMPIGLLVFSEQTITGTWSDELGYPVKSEGILTDLQFFPDALLEGKKSLKMLNVDNISFASNMVQKSESTWDSLGAFHASNIKLFEADDKKIQSIGFLKYDVKIDDHKIEALSSFVQDITHLVGHEDMGMFFKFLEEMFLEGDARFTLTVGDLDVSELEDIERLNIGLFETKGGIFRSDDRLEERNVILEYDFRDLMLLSDEADVLIEGFSFEVGFSGIDVMKVDMLMNLEQLVQDNPLVILDIFKEFLDGVNMGFSITGLQGSHDDLDFSGLNDLSLSLSISGLKQLIPSLVINYKHAGLGIMDEVPAELTPENLSLGLKISRIPVMEIIGSVMGAQASGPVMLELFSRYESQLEIELLDIGFPIGDVSLKGIASTKEQDTSEIEPFHILLLNSVLEIQNIDHLAEAFSKILDTPEVESLKAMVAFIKLIAEEQVYDDGTIVHHLKIASDQQGEITANGKDIKPLINILGN